MTLAFFRRHRKWFMLLMFAALISMVFFGSWSYMGKLSEWFGLGEARVVVGTIDGRNVREGEIREFGFLMRMAGEASQAFGVFLERQATTPDQKRQLYGYTMGMTAWPLLGPTAKGERPDRQTVLTWLALHDEAVRYGFGTAAAEAEARLEALEELGLSGQVLDQFMSQRPGMQRALLVKAFCKDMTVRAYLNWLSEAFSGAVDPELRREFTRMDERIKVRMAVLKAEDALADVKDVPEEALQAQFEKYKKFLAGGGPEGYGYRIPDKVAVEYLVADPAAFEAEAAPKVADADIRAYYDARKDPEYLVQEPKPEAAPAEKKDAAKEEKKDEAAGGAKGEPGKEGPPAAEKPQTPAAEAKTEAAAEPKAALAAPAAPAKKFRPFEEVRDEIRKTLLRREASILAREKLNTNVAEIRPMKPAPQLGIWADGKQVRHVVVPGVHSAEDLAKLEALGKAMHGEEALAAYAVSVVGLVSAEKAKIGLQEISDACIGPDGEAYAFRVTRIEPNHEPAGLKEVHDKVLADVKQANAFGLVRERGQRLIEAASAKGLEAAANEAKIKTVETDLFPRERIIPYGPRWLSFPASLPGVGASQAVVADCFRMVAEKRQRTLVTLAERQVVVVAELMERKAPREAAYSRIRLLLARKVGQELADNALRAVIDMGAIRRRMVVVAEEPSGEVRSPRTQADPDPESEE